MKSIFGDGVQRQQADLAQVPGVVYRLSWSPTLSQQSSTSERLEQQTGICSQPWSQKVQVSGPTGPVSDEGSLSGLQAPAISPCAPLKDRGESPVLSLLIRALIPSWAAHPPDLI